MSRAITFKVPKVFKPLDESISRYKGAKGGRGSGKSFYFADKLLDRYIENPNLRWACMREIQKSIAKSSKQLLEDEITKHGLEDYFEITQTEIRSKKGSGYIVFQGLQDHTADSIKSYEGFDGVWVEEAQTITEYSLDLLIPTIRKNGSEIWFSWNPRLRTDAVEKLFREKDDSLLIHANYTDNPYCPQVIIEEAEEMKRKDPEKYEHIYLGGYTNTLENILFRMIDIQAAMNRHGDTSGATILGIDVARFGDDSSVHCHREGLQVHKFEMREKQSTTQTASWSAYKYNKIKADGAVIDTIGVGAGVFDQMVNQGFYCVDGNFGSPADDTDTYANKRAECYFRLKEAIDHGLALPQDDLLEEELMAIRYFYTDTGKARIVKKEDIKKDLGRSPDRADALALTFYTTIYKDTPLSDESSYSGYDDYVPQNIY